MSDTKYDLGDIIDIYCTRCRLNLDGSVTAMEHTTVVQVTCRTCDNVQKYKPHVPEEVLRERMLKKAFSIRDRRRKQQRETQVAKKTAHSATDVTARWRAATEDSDPRFSRMYREADTYEEGDNIIHSQHGLGVVQQVLHENAALVLFREIECPLEMNRKPEDLE
jgi:hypothetical protein